MKERNRKEMLIMYGSETVSPNWYVKENFPPAFCRVYYVRSGYVIYQDNQMIKQLQEGCLYVFPSACSYEMKQNPSQPLNCLFMHIDIAPYRLSNLIELSIAEGSFLFFLLNTMDVMLSGMPYSKADTMMSGLSETLTAYLCSENLLQTIPAKLAASIDYISEHIKEKISVDTLSGLCGYHTQYYIRLFCSYMGITPHQYLINHRMRLGFFVLTTGKSISEAAECAGYSEVRNFTRAFKKYYGYPPSQVKKHLGLHI